MAGERTNGRHMKMKWIEANELSFGYWVDSTSSSLSSSRAVRTNNLFIEAFSRVVPFHRMNRLLLSSFPSQPIPNPHHHQHRSVVVAVRRIKFFSLSTCFFAFVARRRFFLRRNYSSEYQTYIYEWTLQSFFSSLALLLLIVVVVFFRPFLLIKMYNLRSAS